MGVNNTVNLTDSRLFGFVPHDHVIGKASLVWFSKEKGTGLFDGYRWDRFFRTINKWLKSHVLVSEDNSSEH